MGSEPLPSRVLRGLRKKMQVTGDIAPAWDLLGLQQCWTNRKPDRTGTQVSERPHSQLRPLFHGAPRDVKGMPFLLRPLVPCPLQRCGAAPAPRSLPGPLQPLQGPLRQTQRPPHPRGRPLLQHWAPVPASLPDATLLPRDARRSGRALSPKGAVPLRPDVRPGCKEARGALP